MMTKTKPNEPIVVKDKPVAIERGSYSYHLLEDRAFELLVYSLYKSEIEKGELAGLYDDIWLMEGVKEKGKDCALYRQGIFGAAMQCKHRSKLAPVGKVEVAKEIIKFLLHIINENEEIQQPLHYYFVVSSDFHRTARELLQDFNRQIVLEKDLEKWTTSVISENKALSKIEYKNIKKALYALLASIIVHHKSSTDLTLLLNKPFNINIIDTFFTVKKVVDLTSLDKATDKIISEIEKHSAKKELSAGEITEQLARSSIFLSDYDNFFFNLPDSHIIRKETTELLTWIKAPIVSNKDDDKILLLTGNAGYGKSVILRDLWDQLRGEDIPVLGIKADRYPVSSINELEKKLYLDGNIYSLLEELGNQYERVVVLIDQIDALSQTLSSQRESLNAYRLLINALKEIDNVRIIISVRTFDLNYDPDLQTYKSKKNVTVSLLSDEEVTDVLKTLGAEPAQVSLSLKALLRTPHHLNVFCKIFYKGFVMDTIHTLQDMYQLLWDQTVSSIPENSPLTSSSVKECLQTLAEQMNQKQQISLNKRLYRDEFGREINYLSSQGILTIKGESLEFFHQTFYDFVFARSFVSFGRSVAEYVVDNRNSLYIRASLKMIIGFLREQDHTSYISTLKAIITSDKYFFHIKLLIYNLLGFVESPSLQELQLIERHILPRQNRKWLFIESVYSEEFLIFLIKKKVLDALLTRVKPKIIGKVLPGWVARRLSLPSGRKETSWEKDPKNLCYNLLSKHLPLGRKTVVQYLSSCPDFENKPEFIFRLLYFVRTWDFDEGFRLFESYKDLGYKDKFQFFHILQDAADLNPDWVIEIYKPLLINEINGSPPIKSTSHDTYQEEQLFDKLFSRYPEKAMQFGWEVIGHLVDKQQFPAHHIDALFNDLHFYMFDYDRSESERGTFNQLYVHVIETIAEFQRSNRTQFSAYYSLAVTSGKISLYKVLVYAFNEQEDLCGFSNDVFDFIMAVNERNALVADEKFEFLLRRSLKRYFPYFHEEQKKKIFTLILNLKDPYELHKYTEGGKPNFWRNWGLTEYKYLSVLPEEEVLGASRTRSLFLELQRRYSHIKDTEPNKIRMYSVGPPLDKRAYENMRFEHWISSFKKYDNDDRRFDDHPERGGLTENYRAFKAEVDKRPQHFFPFIEKLFEVQVHPQYIIAGLDGLKSGKVAPEVFLNIYQRAMALPLERFEVMQLIWLSDYLISTHTINEEVLDFLIQQALHHPDPSESKGQPEHEALNTVRGAATERLTAINFNPQWSEKIFDALNKAALDSQISVRVSAVARLANLMHLDKERTLSVFLNATREYLPDVYRVSIWSAQYLANYNFKKLHSYFSNFLKHPEGSEEIATIIAIGYLNKRAGSKKLLRTTFKINDDLKTKIINVGWNNILTGDLIDKDAAHLFLMGRGFSSEAITHEYSLPFLHWPSQSFTILFPVIYKYSRSKAGKKELHYYYEYLLKCMKEDPEKCLQLISNFRQHERPGPGKRMTEEEPVKLAIGLFNALDKLPGKKKKAFRALRIFDQLLRDPYYRRNANKVTEQADQ